MTEEERNALFRMQEARNLTFSRFQQVHSGDLNRYTPEEKRWLRASFLRMPYREMIRPEHADSRRLLGIEDDHVLETVNTYIATHPYVGDARNKHREAVIARIVIADNLTKIHDELVTYLHDKSYPEIRGFETERRTVQLPNSTVAQWLRRNVSDYDRFRAHHSLAPCMMAF